MSTQTKITYRMLERLSFIHRKIQSGCYPNTKQLAFELEAGIATISRDIEYLRDRMNAPIEYDSSHKGYFYIEPYDLHLGELSAADMQTLLVAKSLLSQFKDTPIYDEAADIINLLASNAVRQDVSSIAERIAVPPTPKIIMNKTAWNVILQAFRENRVIEFDYTTRHGSHYNSRRVRPYQILLDDGVCNLFGFCELRQAERMFVLSRMENVQLTEDTFTLPKDFDFYDRAGGGRFGAVFEGKKERYRIEFYKAARYDITECVWADDQVITESENATTITFTSAQHYKVKEWVLSKGSMARPLEPAWLVEQWKQNARELAEMAK